MNPRRRTLTANSKTPIHVSPIAHQFQRLGETIRNNNIIDFFPLRHTLRGYRKEYLPNDLRAGINVALLAFPQGMAYALIAGLPIQYGIYGSAIAAMVTAVFIDNRFIMAGPTNATSVILLTTFASLEVSGAEALSLVSLLILLVGLFIVIGAYLKVANIVQYISRSVITGYVTAAALLIISNQIPKALGLHLDEKGGTFLESVQLTLASFSAVHWATCAIAAGTGGLYILLNRYFKTLPNVAICLVAVSAATALLTDKPEGVEFLPGINAADWSATLPELSFDSVLQLSSPAFAIALLCILEGLSIGKTLAAKTGSRIDSNQTMFAFGMANIGCAFLAGMPASGSLTRSSLNVTSGNRSVLSGYISGVLVFIGAFAFGPFVRFVPQSALAVLVIAIGFSLINKSAIRIVTQATRSDATVFCVTFVSGLILPLDTAIYVGVGTSIVLFLRKVARPEMVEYAFNQEGELAQIEQPELRSAPEVSIVHVEGELFFGAAEIFRDQMRRVCEDPNLKVVVLKMRNAHNMDATAVMALQELLKYMGEKNRYLILSEVKADLHRVLENSGLSKTIEERNIFPDDPRNPTASTAKALKRAKDYLGEAEANVSIYVDPARDSEKRDRGE